jgi:hypothetical protein
MRVNHDRAAMNLERALPEPLVTSLGNDCIYETEE